MSETWNKIKELWRKHPYLFAGGIFIVGLLIIYLLFRKPATSTTNSGTDLSSYYAAAAAATQSGNDLQAQQVAAAAAVQASNNQLTGQLAAIQTAGQTANTAAMEQTQQTQILANAATNQTAINAQSTEYTSLLGALVAGQNLSAANLQTAIQGITSVSNTYNAANPGNTDTPPGVNAIGNLLINMNQDIGVRGINELTYVAPTIPQITLPKLANG